VLSFKICFVSVDFVPPIILSSYFNIWLLFESFSSLSHLFVFSISSSPNKSQIRNLESKSVFFMFKLYSCLRLLLLLFFPICVMYSPREREQRRIVDQRCEKLSHGLGVLEREVDKCRRLFYDLQALWEKEVQRQKNERRRRAAVVIIQNYIRKWLVRRAYLKFLPVTTSIQCCWRNVLAIREF